MLAINEIFQSIQGEGHWTGTPSIFIRLQGCNVGCAFCDTKETWSLDDKDKKSIEEVLNKPASGSGNWCQATEQATIDHITAMAPPPYHVVITGGEPMMHDLIDLTNNLINSGYSVQIETSGTIPISEKYNKKVWFTVSPKPEMPGGYPVYYDNIRQYASEIKQVICTRKDLEKLHQEFDGLDFEGEIWLQPVSQSKKATKLCIEACLLHNYRLSIQTHKYLDLR